MATDNVRVRMYNVGFGDSFLIEFARPDDRPYRILVDCGSHSAGHPESGWQIQTVVDQIIADATDDGDGCNIDVVVATHRHQDHIVGFGSDSWADVTVGEVWMPWTEDPGDRTARALQARQEQLALALHGALDQAPTHGFYEAERARSMLDLVQNSLTNSQAVKTLQTGFRGRPRRRYLAAGDPLITDDTIKDLRVHVLGPSRDESIIRDLDPPAGQSYIAGLATASSDEILPFQRRYAIKPADLLANPPWRHLEVPEEIREAAQGVLADGDEWNAVSLDRAINGTSLVLVFEFGDARLLFPGDAQWGTWEMMLNDPHSRALLTDTTFYKVGHHGSHNATPRTYVEELVGPSLWAAAASVHRVQQWPNIPKPELLTALREKCSRVVTSNAPPKSKSGVHVGEGTIDFAVPC